VSKRDGDAAEAEAKGIAEAAKARRKHYPTRRCP
jgi:hypothetical protein